MGSGSVMQKLTSPPQTEDVVLSAFETCCAVLRSLEVAGVQAAQDEDDERQRRIGRTIGLVRETISELRAIAEGDLNAPAAGFVLPQHSPFRNGPRRARVSGRGLGAA